jgi:hypothetical protein
VNIFVTGATGFVGSALVQELLQHGHTVTVLARSPASAAALREAGAQALAGDIADPETLCRGVSQADGVIHLAFNYNYSQNEKSVGECVQRRLHPPFRTAAGALCTGATRSCALTGVGVSSGGRTARDAAANISVSSPGRNEGDDSPPPEALRSAESPFAPCLRPHSRGEQFITRLKAVPKDFSDS